ncbi:hypothetical protein GCM10027299_21660 [Larkinella ripae]
MDTSKIKRISKDYWMHSHLSIARFYGSIKINGIQYILNPKTEELVRADVLKAERKKERDAKKAAKAAA